MGFERSKPGEERRKSPRFNAELSVEVRSRRGTQFYLTKNVSLEGCYIDTEHTLEPDHVFQVLLYPPGDDYGITFVAHVRNVTTPEEALDVGRPAGMGLEIFAIDRDEKARWVDLLTNLAEIHEQQHGPAEAACRTSDFERVASDRRMHVRHAIRMEVEVRDMRSLYRLFSKNMSVGGIYLESDEKLPVGTPVDVFLTHPLTKAKTAVPGKVARTDDNGMGIEFRGLTEKERRAFLRFALTGRAPNPPQR